MKSGAEVLVAGVSGVVEEVLVVPFCFPLLVGTFSFFLAPTFFVTFDVGLLAGTFFAGVFLVLAIVLSN